jgi:hypothetical protein
MPMEMYVKFEDIKLAKKVKECVAIGQTMPVRYEDEVAIVMCREHKVPLKQAIFAIAYILQTHDDELKFID